jgi:hypothetical protein
MHKRKLLEDQVFRDLYIECDKAFFWVPGDPRLESLARRVIEWSDDKPGSSPPVEEEAAGAFVVTQLLSADVEAMSPAWTQLERIVSDLTQPQRGLKAWR